MTASSTGRGLSDGERPHGLVEGGEPSKRTEGQAEHQVAISTLDDAGPGDGVVLAGRRRVERADRAHLPEHARHRSGPEQTDHARLTAPL